MGKHRHLLSTDQRSTQSKAGWLHSAKLLGCTEIGLLIKPKDSALPVFDTTRIHAEAAASMALDVK